MSKKDDVPVGQVLTRKNRKKYLVIQVPSGVIDDPCSICAFFRKGRTCSKPPCIPGERSDARDVIFIRIHPTKE